MTGVCIARLSFFGEAGFFLENLSHRETHFNKT